MSSIFDEHKGLYMFILSFIINMTPALTLATNYQAVSQNSSFLDMEYANLTWTVNDDVASFSLVANKSLANLGSNQYFYISFAFSYDQKMGNDCVLACCLSNNGSFVQHMYNKGKTCELLDPSNSYVGLSDISIINVNGMVTCSFKRNVSDANVTNYFNISKNSYYILYAKGPMQNRTKKINAEIFLGKPIMHDETSTSNTAVYFNSTSVTYSNLGGTVSDLKKVHGCLMVIAWVFTASIGMVLARYYKYIFPSVKWLYMPFWFNMHRWSMTSVPLMSIAGFIVILVDMNWTWSTPSDYLGFSHSIVGIMAVILSIIQVLVAFCRPDKDHPRRPVFNWFHKSVAYSSYTLSIAAVITGIMLPNISIFVNFWIIVTAFCIWLIMFIIIFEIMSIVYEVKPSNPGEEPSDEEKNNKSKFETFKTLFLGIFLTNAMIVTVAVCINVSIN